MWEFRRTAGRIRRGLCLKAARSEALRCRRRLRLLLLLALAHGSRLLRRRFRRRCCGRLLLRMQSAQASKSVSRSIE